MTLIAIEHKDPDLFPKIILAAIGLLAAMTFISCSTGCAYFKDKEKKIEEKTLSVMGPDHRRRESQGASRR